MKKLTWFYVSIHQVKFSNYCDLDMRKSMVGGKRRMKKILLFI